MRPTLALLLLPLALAACASPEQKAARKAELQAVVASAEKTGKDDACAWATPVYNFTPVDEENLILQTNEGRYLLRFGGFCQARLTDGLAIGLQSTAGSVCPGDRVFVEGRPCLITKMWKVPETAKVAEAAR